MHDCIIGYICDLLQAKTFKTNESKLFIQIESYDIIVMHH
jgi:hypothetical protein